MRDFSFLFLPHSGLFFCKWNTDEVMSAHKRRLQICFRGGSAAGEQQAPPIALDDGGREGPQNQRKEKEKIKGSVCV